MQKANANLYVVLMKERQCSGLAQRIEVIHDGGRQQSGAKHGIFGQNMYLNCKNEET